MQVNLITNNQNNSFKAMYFHDTGIQRKFIDSLDNKQLEYLQNLFEGESKNPVNAMIYSDNGYLLKAKIVCKYKIDKFKEDFRQIPFIESKISFIKRVAKIIHKYNESLCKMQ